MKHDLLAEIRKEEEKAARAIAEAEKKGQDELASVTLRLDQNRDKLIRKREEALSKARDKACQEAEAEASKIAEKAKKDAEQLRSRAAKQVKKAADLAAGKVQELWEQQG